MIQKCFDWKVVIVKMREIGLEWLSYHFAVSERCSMLMFLVLADNLSKFTHRGRLIKQQFLKHNYDLC